MTATDLDPDTLDLLSQIPAGGRQGPCDEQAFWQAMSQIAGALSVFRETVIADCAGAPADPGRALLDLLLSPAPLPIEVGEQAAEARWKVPQRVVAVALDHLPRNSVFPADILVGRHRRTPCLIVPDPDGPGRRAAIEAMLSGHDAAVGIPTSPDQAARSLRWARQALQLKSFRILPARRTIFAADHLALLLLTQDPDLAVFAICQTLRPLMTVRESLRRGLAETLIACLEHNFNATAVAGRLHLHPQTVRYRVRNLEALFGEQLTAPDRRLELHMVLTLWLATRPGPTGKIAPLWG